MFAFCYLDKKNVAALSTKEFYDTVLFDTWLAKKMKLCRIFIFMWLSIRLLNIALFFAFDLGIYALNLPVMTNVSMNEVDYVSVTVDFNLCRKNIFESLTVQRAIVASLFLQNLLQLLFDLADTLHYLYSKQGGNWNLWTEKGRKKLAVQVIFYRGMQLLSSLGICVGSSQALYASYTGHALWNIELLFQILYLQISLGVTWSVLYFVQLSPWIGKTVVSIQLMVQDLLRFILVYLIMLVMFSLAFLRLVADATNKNGECSRDFATLPDALYRWAIS